MKLKKINHIGIAVKSIEQSKPFYGDVLGLTFKGIETVTEQKVKVAFFQAGESLIELLEPLEEDSPVQKFLDKRGEGFHHICYEVDDIKEYLRHLREKGIRLINEEPRIGAEGLPIAFLHPKSTGSVLTELLEKRE
ncbi:MAG: methylmalonyl-CoA epimerase [Candidatus Hodarchaeales archaeon]